MSRLAGVARHIRESPHNLMSPRALDELESRHIPECVALAALLPPGPARLVDVGSGGGLPGLVIAMVRDDVDVTLVEATGKKARFLEETARDLGLDVTVHNGRVEDAEGLRGRFDLATARAVAPLERLIPWTLPLLRPGGLLFAVKGSSWQQEVESAAPALEAAGARMVATPPDPRAYVGDVDPPLRVVIIAAPRHPEVP